MAAGDYDEQGTTEARRAPIELGPRVFRGAPVLGKALPKPAQDYFDASATPMAQVYARKFPGLDNVLTRIRGAGIRDGLAVRVTGEELALLGRSGVVDAVQIEQSLARMRAVWGNERMDTSRPLSRVYPQSQIESLYGPVDPVTGEATVTNPDPRGGGYAGATERIPPGARADDVAMRESLGINGPEAGYDTAYTSWGRLYDRYKKANDPLFEVVFRTKAELDVPLPQDNKTGYRKLAEVDPVSHHVAGTGRTKGGVPEGIVPVGAPIEIIEIRPVGTPRASYPSETSYGPFPPTPPKVRSLGATLRGAGSGITNQAREEDE